ncbi:Phospholipase A2-delta [Cardamine amara subsp. amara]|uniref:phospholipase A2 n=1 Tax=Cardamine amara subsp. amara TaxID=228776 RepID=A0ABD1AWJ7_CARAN
MIRGGALAPLAFGLTAFLLLAVVYSQEECSKTCKAETCNGYGIRYGKYCGLGYFGCPGEKPCDALDDCCMKHDKCVDEKGMTYIECHQNLQRCVNELNREIKESNNKKLGFSKQCPYSTVIPTVYQGMGYGIFFSGIGNLIHLGPVKAPGAELNLARSKADTKDGLGKNKRLQKKEGSKVSAPMSPSPS